MEMGDCSWEFNAPQYHDFRSHRDDDDVESYFDIDHERKIANEYPDPEPGNDIWEQNTEVPGEVESQEIKKEKDSPKETPNGRNKSVIEETVHTPTPGNRRLTRSMCATPVNDKGLPEATDPISSVKGKEERDEYHSAPGSPTSTKSTGSEGGVAKPAAKIPSNLCTDLEEWKRKRAGCKRMYPNGTTTQPKKAVTSVGDGSKSNIQTGKSNNLAGRSRAVGRHERKDSAEKVLVKHTRSASLRRAHSIERLNQAQRGRSQGVKSPAGNNRHRRSGSNIPIQHTDSMEKLNTPRTRSHSLKRTYSTDQEENRVTKAARITRSASVRSLDTSAGHRPRSDSASSVRSNVSDGKTEGPTHKMPKLTIPSTPTFMKRKPMGKTDRVKNAEEKELEEIAHMRKELAKKRAMSQKSYHKAMASTGYVPHHSSKEPTMPVDLHFSTDARIKSQPVIHNDKSTDFVRTLRSSSKDLPANKALTRPEPFSLSESRKPKVEPGSESHPTNSFKSMAEHVQAFHRQTPERFRSKVMGPPQRCTRGRSPGELTIPKTPQLETRSRTRQVHIPSQKELEEQEIEEMKKHQIKANPVNHKILTEPCVGVKKVTPKPLTQPEEFNLHKSQNLRSNRSQEEETYQFHANPCPTKILERPVGVKPAKGLPLTCPQSPAFALKHRVRMPLEPEEEKKVNTSTTRRSVPHHGVPFQPVLSHKITVPQPFTFEDREKSRQVQKEARIEHYLEEEQKMEEMMVRAHPVPHSGVPFQPKLSHSCTKPQPFSFEERDHVMESRKQEKIQEVYYKEKKAREFHAQPLPDHETHLPQRQPRPLTKPEPFDLHIDKRGARRAEEWNSKLAEEEEEMKQRATFRAKPAVVTQKEPYRAQKSTKPLTDITEFTLSTEQRSQQREDFEMFKKAREAQLESVKRQEALRKEEEEKQIIAKLRKQAVHQANPIKRFRPVEVAPSDKPLTKPASPQFQTDRRLRSKLQS